MEDLCVCVGVIHESAESEGRLQRGGWEKGNKDCRDCGIDWKGRGGSMCMGIRIDNTSFPEKMQMHLCRKLS